jgi:hypothetical protein
MAADKATGRKAERDRRSYIWRSYGITEADYDRLMVDQRGRCGICGTKPVGKARLHLDHDHATGRQRGFLCFRCNNALGDFSDNVTLLRAAIQWLSESDDEQLRIERLVRQRLERELLRQQ